MIIFCGLSNIEFKTAYWSCNSFSFSLNALLARINIFSVCLYSVMSTAVTRHIFRFWVIMPVRCTLIGRLSLVNNTTWQVSVVVLLKTWSKKISNIGFVSAETNNPNRLFFNRQDSLPSIAAPLMFNRIISPTCVRVK